MLFSLITVATPDGHHHRRHHSPPPLPPSLLVIHLKQAPLLSIIDVAGNTLTGSLPRSWTFLPWLTQVDVSYNRLQGTLPMDLALASMLTSLRMHSNPNITGTISPWFRWVGCGV